MKYELDSKRIRNIYIMLISILCMTIISTTAILSYILVHWDDKTNKPVNTATNTEYDVSSFKEISYDEFMDKYKDKNKSLIYIGRATCIHCINFLHILKQVQKEYDYTTYYLDISAVTEKQATKIKKLDKFLDENFGMTPMVIVVKEGKLVDNDGWLGESDYEDFSNYLEKVGYSKKD